MTRYRLELAGPADDEDLRHVLACTPMPGDIALTFRREPSFFRGAGVDGFQRQIVACRDTETGRIVGFGCRSLRKLHVNGVVRTIGYLSTIRLLAEHRNLGLLARGYRFFRDLHQDGQAPFYLTTIAESNEAALRLFTSGRAGLPTYHAAGTYVTVALPAGKRNPPRLTGGMSVRRATDGDWSAILAFLATHGPRRQFFPSYSMLDVATPAGALFGLAANDVRLAVRNDEIVGVLAGWRQQSFRQTIVHNYAGWLRWLRPVYNSWTWLRGRPMLPSPGEPIRYITAALPVVANDDTGVFDALLQTLLFEATDCDYVAVGMAEGDPHLPVVRRLGGTAYATRIFHVCWPDGDAERLKLDGRPTYLELGSL